MSFRGNFWRRDRKEGKVVGGAGVGRQGGERARVKVRVGVETRVRVRVGVGVRAG